MSVYKAIVVIFTLLLLSSDLEADEAPVCRSGVCSFHVSGKEMISPCNGLSGLMVYSQSTGAALVQCSDPVSNETRTLAFDRSSDANQYNIEEGRFYRAEGLSALVEDGVPDRFGRVPLCRPNQAPHPAIFLILEKIPSAAETSPYCYRIYYVDASATALYVARDDGYKVPPASKKTVAKWSALRRKLTALIKPQPFPK